MIERRLEQAHRLHRQADGAGLSRVSKTGEGQHMSERLAALAGLAAALAALAGFIPGLYRDPTVVVEQSHGYDVANLVVAAFLELGVLFAIRGSVRGRLIAIGALGCLAYSFVTYAFFIVLNPATILYIAVLGFAGWSFVAGFTNIDDAEVVAVIHGRLARRTTAGFLMLIALLFAATWLSQIAGATFSRNLPPDLVTAGWPMNPVWVLDLGFVLPLALVTSLRLVRRQPGAERMAVSFLVFDALLAVSILMMVAAAALAGQAFETPMVGLFIALLVASASLAWLALRRR